MREHEFAPLEEWSSKQMDGYAKIGLLHKNMSIEDIARRSRGSLAYLATPYSKHVFSDGKFDYDKSTALGIEAARWCARFASVGVTAVSPIAQGANMVLFQGDKSLDPLNETFWGRWCFPLLQASKCIIVPPIPGWDSSIGILDEVLSALDYQRPVFLVKPSEGVDQ